MKNLNVFEQQEQLLKEFNRFIELRGYLLGVPKQFRELWNKAKEESKALNDRCNTINGKSPLKHKPIKTREKEESKTQPVYIERKGKLIKAKFNKEKHTFIY